MSDASFFPPSRAHASFAQRFAARDLIATNLRSDDLRETLSARDLEQLHLAQRLLRIDPDRDVADTMAARGLHSAHHVAALPEAVFVKRHADAFGGDAARAVKYHRRATSIKARAQHAFVNLKTHLSDPHYRGVMGNNTQPSVAAAVAGVPSYQALFGSLNYLSADPWRSMTGPAAYFVDLMRLADAYVTTLNAGSIPSGFTLAARRPDLFSKPLTQDAVFAPIPTLTIVIEVLEAAVTSMATVLSVPETDNDPLQQCALNAYPVGLPYHAPLGQTRANLQASGNSLANVFQQMSGAADCNVTAADCNVTAADRNVTAAEALGLSLEAYGVLTSDHTDATLNVLYGLPPQDTPKIALAAVPAFLQATGLSRSDLEALLMQNLSPGELQANLASWLYINDTAESLQPMAIVYDLSDPAHPTETIQNLSSTRLDRVARLIRLARVTGWSYADTDWAINCAGGRLDPTAIGTLAVLQKTMAALDVPLGVATADADNVKSIGRVSDTNPQDAFDTIFNNPALVGSSGASPFYFSTGMSSWDPQSTAAQDVVIRTRLAGALGLSNDQLTALLVATGRDTQTNFSIVDWSVLLKMSLAARASTLGISAAIQLFTIVGTDAETPGIVMAWLQLANWAAVSGLSVADIAFVVDGGYSLGVSLGYDPQALADQLPTVVAAAATAATPLRLTPQSFAVSGLDPSLAQDVFNALQGANVITSIGIVTGSSETTAVTARAFAFTPTSFEQAASPLSPADSQTAYTGLVTQNVLVGNQTSAVLSATYTVGESIAFLGQTPYSLPPADIVAVGAMLDATLKNIDQSQAQITQVLASATAAQTQAVAQSLAQLIQADASLVQVMLPLAARELGLTDLLVEYLTPPPDSSTTYPALGQLVQTMSRMLVVANGLQLTAADVTAIGAASTAFDIANLAITTVGNLQSLTSYRQLYARFGAQGGPAFRAYLTSPNTSDQQAAKLGALSKIAGWNSNDLQTLVTTFWPNAQTYGTVGGVAQLARVFDLSSSTGISITGLFALNSLSSSPLSDAENAPWTGHFNAQSWKAFTAAADATANGLATARGRTAALPSTRAATRDALVASALALADVMYEAVFTADDLSQFLLIDVLTSDNDQTSLVSQAILSVQTYLQRCRLSLEPGVKQIGIPEEWWEWMATYPLWQANRLVFLYPESYIDPSLRKGASTLFTDLQQQLLQNQVTDDSVTNAFAAYLQGFAALTHLRIVSTYRCAIANLLDPSEPSLDTLFLFARSSTSPYSYYYRTATNLAVTSSSVTATWSPWQTIDVTIASPYVSPVYAFGKLFLFWVEVTNSQSASLSGGTQNSLNATTADLRFSFVNLQGHWSSPQTLATDVPIVFGPNSYYQTSSQGPAYLVETNYDPTTPWWQRVYALSVPAGAFQPGANGPFNNADQILVGYGYGIWFAAGTPFQLKAPPAPNSTTPPEQSDLAAYNQALYLSAGVAGTLASGVASGFVLHVPPISISSQLLIQQLNTRAVFTQASPAGGPTVYLPMPTIAQSFGETSIKVENASTIIFPDFYSDVILTGTQDSSDGIPGIGGGAIRDSSEALFSNIATSNLSLLSVENDPASFVFDNGDDVFLALVQPPAGTAPPTTISELAAVSTASVSPSAASPSGPLTPQGVSSVQVYYVYPSESPFAGTPDAKQLNYAVVRLGTNTAATLSDRLLLGGVETLLTVASQQLPELAFARFYPNQQKPSQLTVVPTDTLDFTSAEGPYFWELFFHAPFLVASQLAAAQQYADAKQWFEYIFDPMSQAVVDDPGFPNDRYWQFVPFRGVTWDTLLSALANTAAIAAYNDDPFDPHAIAGVRPSVYPQAIVMQYVDNLIDWGDLLFTQNTRESINQASTLYMLASSLLGPRPQSQGVAPMPPAKSYAEIAALYDVTGTMQTATPTTITLATSAAAIDNYYNGCAITLMSDGQPIGTATITAYAGGNQTATVSPPWTTAPTTGDTYRISSIPQFLIDLETLTGQPQGQTQFAQPPLGEITMYFTIPENAAFLAYWDRVQDRLFKIRHGLSITGIAQTLPLYSPPLDVGSLVRAAASGGSVLGLAQSAPLPLLPFRFSVVIQQAKALAEVVATLGTTLLSALEQGDGETLSMLQLTQGATLLQLQTQMKQAAIIVNQNEGLALQQSQNAALARQQYYAGLVAGGLSPGEQAALDQMLTALVLNALSGVAQTASSIAYMIPQVGSPFAMTFGGAQLGPALAGAGTAFQIGAEIATYIGESSLQNATYQRRSADWAFQGQQAVIDVQQIAAQIAGNTIQSGILTQDLVVHRQQIAQNAALQSYYIQKFTSQQLYSWMAARLAAIYYQTYSLAFDLSQRAQLAFQYEFDTTQTFVNFGYWDSTRQGLLSGEALRLSLLQMESAALVASTRRLELRKTISLLQLDPLALFNLREYGSCTLTFPELLFDQDYPGHYARKVKTISVSLPAIVGPYQDIKATLTQTSNTIVLTPDPAVTLYLLQPQQEASAPGPDQLRRNWCANQQVVLSRGVDDSGLLVLNFDDERYLPFEGTGAVSTWTLNMPKAANRIDYATISDVIITLEYTALDGGQTLFDAVVADSSVKGYAGGIAFALQQQCADAWFAFMADRSSTTTQTLTFQLPPAIAPYNVTGVVTVAGYYLRLDVDGEIPVSGTSPFLSVGLPGATSFTSAPLDATNGFNCPMTPVSLTSLTGTWKIQFNLTNTPPALVTSGYLNPAVLDNIVLILNLTGTLNWQPPPAAARAARGVRRRSS